MQNKEIQSEDVARWKRVFAQYRPLLKPNRITGAALYAYLAAHYPLLMLEDPRAEQMVRDNILKNECFSCELPQGILPNPVCCVIEPVGSGKALYRDQDPVFFGCEILVGIDLASGYFLVEGSSALWDELFAKRGLNENDLENFYLVAEYIGCLTRFALLEETLAQMAQ